MLMRSRGRELLSLQVRTSVDVLGHTFDTLAAHISETRKNWPKQPVDLFGGDIIQNELLACHLYITLAEEEGKRRIRVVIDWLKYELGRRIRASRRKQLGEQAQSIAQMLAYLESYASNCHLHCTATWHYPLAAVSTIIQLPLLKIHFPGLPLEQISGVRFTALSSSPLQYVILDLDDPDHLTVTAAYAFFDALSPGVDDEALKRGEELKDTFVKQREEGAAV